MDWYEIIPTDKLFQFFLNNDIISYSFTCKKVYNQFTNIKKKIQQDISFGLDSIPVTLENTLDREWFPKRFLYTNYLMKYDSSNFTFTSFENLASAYDGCECLGISCNKSSCSCHLRFKDPASIYHNGKLLLPRPKNSPPIIECNSECTCPIWCPRRLIQKGRKVKINVKKGIDKGWGAYATQCIKKGVFVCEYTGEIISDKEARNRYIKYDVSGDNYILSVIESFGSKTIQTNIDATKYGNVSRFINHSCNPNLVLETVRVNNITPHIAFFAKRDIDINEELSFDYGGFDSYGDKNSDLVSLGSHPCRCLDKNCREFLPYDRSL